MEERKQKDNQSRSDSESHVLYRFFQSKSSLEIEHGAAKTKVI